MKIRIHGYLTLGKAMGGESMLEIREERATVRQVVEGLCATRGSPLKEMMMDPETGTLREHIRILVNGRHCRHLRHGLDTALRDGDAISLFPPAAGG